MQTSILVISNYRNSSMSYMSSLHGYGFDIDSTRTFETARILLRAGNRPDAIIIDVKFHTDEITAFIQFVRQQISQSTGIIIIGSEYEWLRAYGADVCIERPADFQDMVAIFEPIQ